MLTPNHSFTYCADSAADRSPMSRPWCRGLLLTVLLQGVLLPIAILAPSHAEPPPAREMAADERGQYDSSETPLSEEDQALKRLLATQEPSPVDFEPYINIEAELTPEEKALKDALAASPQVPAELARNGEPANGDRTGQCSTSGGCNNFNTNFPTGTFSTTSSSWTTVASNIFAGEFAYYSVVLGAEYEWTLCSTDGANAPYDSQLTLWNQAGTTRFCYSDDFCGDDAKIQWTATFTGTVRVLVSQYNCVNNTTSTTLRWRRSAAPSEQCSPCGTTDYGPFTPTTSWQTHSAGVGLGGPSAACRWYRFSVTAGRRYDFTLCTGGGAYSGDTEMWLYNSSCTLITSNDDSCSLGSAITNWLAPSTGTVYLKLASHNSNAASWTLAYRYSPQCTACGTYQFGPFTPASSWQTHSSSVDPGGPSEQCKWYRFDVTSGQRYDFTLCTGGGAYSGDTEMWLYNSSCTLITSNDDSCSLGSAITNWLATSSGAVYLRLASHNSNAASWTLAYRVQPSCLQCPSFNYTLPAPTTSWQQDVWSVPAGGCYMYRVSLESGNQYTFKTGCGDGATSNFDTILNVYNSACTEVAQNDDACESNRSQVTFTATSTGNYYVKVSGFSGVGGNYTLVYKRETPTCAHGMTLGTVTGCPSGSVAPNSSQSGTVVGSWWNNSDCPACLERLVVGWRNLSTGAWVGPEPVDLGVSQIPATCPPGQSFGTRNWSIAAPSAAGTYHLWIFMAQAVSAEQAIQGFKSHAQTSETAYEKRLCVNVVVQPPPPDTGACCFSNGNCQILTQSQCSSQGGQWQGANTSCSPNPCPQPPPTTGACCFSNGSCQILTQSQCSSQGGAWQGPSTSCSPNPCGSRTVSISTASGAPGGPVTVCVLLNASGNENALGFSLNFDPNVLSFVSAALGTDAVGAILNVNSNQTSQGRLGIALALQPGQSFAAGTRQVVCITFNIASATGATSTPLSFGDQPIRREVVNVGATPLPATWIGGTVTISSCTGWEGDTAPPPDGDGTLSIADWVQCGRYVAQIHPLPTACCPFQKVDCAPRSTLGDGGVTTADWTQCGRYVAGIDPPTPVGGPCPGRESTETAVDDLAREGSRIATTVSVLDATIVRGQSGTVAIQMQSQGVENGVGFSLTWNAAQLSYSGVALGSAVAGAALLPNTSQAANGRLGVAMAMPPGQTFPQGAVTILVVTFAAVADAPGSTQIAFSDQPIAREIADVNAAVVPANWVPGTITVSAAPSTWYRDSDGDGYGNPAVTTQAVQQPAGYVANDDDCDDNCSSCHPGGTEVCDSKDNDCNGQVDEGGVCGEANTDSDGDGTPNSLDGCPNDPNKIAPGVCGCGVADTDSDGDGTPNCNDGCPNTPGATQPHACGQCGGLCGVGMAVTTPLTLIALRLQRRRRRW